jgi:hypothetical protein
MDIRIDSLVPFAEGYAFGKTGPYERLKGVARGTLDPLAPQNACIVDLDKSLRNARGLVEYEVDVDILRPVDATNSNRLLFYEVTNRGNKLLGRLLHGVSSAIPTDLNDPLTLAHAGNGLLFERGATLVWSGWDATVPNRNANLCARLPLALEDGKPMVRRIREEFQVGKRIAAAETLALTYPAASLDKRKARLMMRRRESDPRIEIPADQWAFADPRQVRLLPQGTPLIPLAIYEFWYEATESRVAGIGFAAVRDLISSLRHDSASPLAASPPRYTMGFGISQGGRFLRHFLDLGMNCDGAGRRVFDGVFSHTAGAGKLFANHSFAEPNRTAAQHEDRRYPEAWFPFSTSDATDPFTTKTGSILRGDGTDPLIIQTNSSSEYWQKGASLVTIDALGEADLAMPDNSRVYLIAGTQHATSPPAAARGPNANQGNPQSQAPAVRALVVALEQWLIDGTQPPPSRVPSLAEGTAVAAASIRFPSAPDFATPRGSNVITTPVDWIDPPGSPDSKADQPAGRYVTLVSAIDADGNEVAGIRLPPVAVPLATYAGWNVYRDNPDELADRDGSQIPFARTKADREATGDSRPSLQERYRSLADYVARVQACVDALVADRLLLPADANAYVDAAKASDSFAAAPVLAAAK